MKALTNPTLDLAGLFVLVGVVVWLLNALDASAAVAVAAVVGISGLAGPVVGRFADHLGLLR